MKLNELTLIKAIEMLRNKEITLDDVYADTRAAVDAHNPSVNAYLALNEQALEQAKQRSTMPLAGVPIAVKDNYLTRGIVTTASSKLLETFVPQFESTVTARMMDAGGVTFGKTNLDAWAHGSSTETSDFGPTLNPRNPAHVPGGSSGGSAAAVAADMCIAALGTETAGSTRLPAAWCGVVGLKPTYGRVSRAGIVPMGSSLDSPGPITKTVADTALLFGLIAGEDPYDATTTDQPVGEYIASLDKGIKGMRIGVCYLDHEHIAGTPAAKSVEDAADLFTSLGAIVEYVPLSAKPAPKTVLTHEYAISVYTVIQRSEVSSNMARYDGVRYGKDRSTLGAEAKRRIMLGTYTLMKGVGLKYYQTAQKVRTLYIQNFQDLFTHYDALISPTSPGYALKLGESAGNPMFGELMDMLVEPSTIAGLPGISVPSHHDPETNLYLGLNIVANQWQEETILRLAYAFEQNTKWNPWIKR